MGRGFGGSGAGDAAAHGAGDAAALQLGKFRQGSGVPVGNRGLPESEPALEVRWGQVYADVQALVRVECVAPIGSGAEQDGLPELAHHRQVRLKVHPGDVDEDGAEQVKLFGLALATAVFLDALVIRIVLLPAVLELLGRRTWAFPHWFDRRLPRLAIEPPPTPQPAPAFDQAA